MVVQMDPIQDYASLSRELTTQIKSKLIGRPVVWLKGLKADPRHRVAAKVFTIAVTFFLAITIVGLIPLLKAVSYAKKLDNYSGLSSEDIPETPEVGLIEFKTKQQTFNHERDFVIHEGALWTRQRNALDAPWELIYFDRENDCEPVEVQADGANLMVMDNERTLHYKKVMKEKRKSGHYTAIDLALRDNWTKGWFTFPVIEKIVNLINGNRKLQVPEGAVGWGMSHRGVYTRYFVDQGGKQHHEFPMVTSAYMVPKGGRELRFTDPYVASRFTKSIPLPENFVIELFAVSASTLFLYGTVDGERKLFTLLADFDTLGMNIMLAGFWRKMRRGPWEWEEQPLFPQEGEVRSISIEQTGEGNDARRLHIVVENDQGQEQHLSKMLKEDEWS